MAENDIVARLRMADCKLDGRALEDHADALCREAAAYIEAMETIIRDLAALPPGGEVWKRSKWLAELTERAKVMLATAIASGAYRETGSD